jgi:hypothetical protein
VCSCIEIVVDVRIERRHFSSEILIQSFYQLVQWDERSNLPWKLSFTKCSFVENWGDHCPAIPQISLVVPTEPQSSIERHIPIPFGEHVLVENSFFSQPDAPLHRYSEVVLRQKRSIRQPQCERDVTPGTCSFNNLWRRKK